MIEVRRAMRSTLLAVAISGSLIAAGCSQPEPPVEEPDEIAEPTAETDGPEPLVIPDYAATAEHRIPEMPDDAELERLRAAAAADPSSVRARRELALALGKAGLPGEAVEIFERAVAASPTPDNLLDLAMGYGMAARYDEADKAYRRLIALVPDHAVALHNLGNISMKQGKPEEAIRLYQAALEARPGYLLAQFHMADALRDLGMYREAYQTYERVLSLEPTSPQELQAYDDALYELASLDLKMGAHARAAEMLKELVTLRPDHASAHYAYGQALLQLGRTEEAQREFETHMQLQAKATRTSPMAHGD
jgi:tetratricopeptide (TPR) repeat protein